MGLPRLVLARPRQFLSTFGTKRVLSLLTGRPELHLRTILSRPMRHPLQTGAKPVPEILTRRLPVATLAHAGRERKRRAFFAIEFLLDERPSAIAPAMETALLALSDPATLTWLLRMIETRRETASMIVAACRGALTELADRPHLTIRALARRLLPACDLPLPRSLDPDPALLDRLVVRPPVPIGVNPRESERPAPDGLVDELAGVRLSKAERIVPGLRSAVIGRLSVTLGSDAHRRRMQRQYRAYGDTVRRRPPDVFLASCEAVENAVQLSAAGARAARLMNGQPFIDSIEIEQTLPTP